MFMHIDVSLVGFGAHFDNMFNGMPLPYSFKQFYITQQDIIVAPKVWHTKCQFIL